MKKQFILAIALLTTIAHADVQLDIDPHIKVVAIDGQSVNQNPLQPTKKQFTLSAGHHTITARYDRLYQLGRNDHDYLKSANITISTELHDNQIYRLVMPNQPEHYQKAKAFAKMPTLAIMHGDVIIAGQSVQADDGGFFDNLKGIFGKNTQTQPTANPQAQNSTPPNHTNPNTESDTLDRFIQLWHNASDDEREKIRQWLK